jgi:L-asparaginase II
MTDTTPQLAARVFRGDEIEALHYASIAVVDASGKLTHCLGDPEMVSMTRSCIKPFQALPLLTTGAVDHFKFTPRQLAIMCGSHNGSDDHHAVVQSILETIGCTPDDLRCGCHWPLGMQERVEFPTKGEEHDSVRHNCSGKHAGFLALAKFLGDDVSTYLDPESRTQKFIKQAVSDFCEYPIEKMPTGIDGCSAPNFPLPVLNIARAFMKLANVDSDDLIVRAALERIRDAMRTHPEMVSGRNRLDLVLMRSFENNIVCKIGAESIEGIGLAEPSVGIAVKVHDGSWRALGAIIIETLKQLDIIVNIEHFPYMKKHEQPEIRNVRDLVTGRIVPSFKLRKV